MVDIKTNYGAIGDGIANDRAAFLAFKGEAAGTTATLTIPAGTYYIGPRANVSDANEDYLFSGILNLTVTATGAKLTDGGTDNDYHLGANGAFYQDPDHSAKIEEVGPGTATVVLKTATDHTKFSVGSWVCVTGLAMQSTGFPINPHYFEFVKISSKQTSTLPYTITFETTLRNTYKSTWPDWGNQGPGEQDLNGPACLYAMKAVWDCTHEYIGLTVEKTGIHNPIAANRKPTNCGLRSVILRNVTATNYDGINPSACKTHSLINCNYTAVTMEVDKCVETLSFSGCQMGTVQFQSSSTDLLTVSNGTTFTGYLLGTPKRTTIDDSTTDRIYPGSYAFGGANSMTLRNSVIAGDIYLGGWLYKGGNAYIGDDIGVNNGLNTMSNGVIRIPKSYTAVSVSWAIPGHWFCWQDPSRYCIRLSQVQAVYDDATYVYIQTNETGSWPSYYSSGGGKLYIRTHPCPDLTVINCSATAPAGTSDGSTIYSLNSAPPNSPIYSYAKYTCTGTAQSQGGDALWGDLQSATIAVNTPYSGTLKFDPLGSFCWTTAHSNGALVNYIPSINAHIGGTRTITYSGGSYSLGGAQTGDSSVAPPENPTWIANRVFGYMETDISGGGSFPSIVVTLQTAQGIPSGYATRGKNGWRNR